MEAHEWKPGNGGADMTVLLNIDVPNLAKGERFYTAAFGLEPARRLSAETLELSGWPAPVYLLEKRTGTSGGGQEARHFERHWTPIHLDIVVEDLDIAVGRALRAGAVLEQPPSDAAYGRIAMLADPFGHGFCLIQFN